VSRAIAGWAITESHLGNAFAELVGPKQTAALSMYAAMRSFELQRAMLEAIVVEKLPKTSARIFCATLAVISRDASIRHKFAHWIWGRSMDIGLSTEALLLVEPKHFWRLRTLKIAFAKKKARNPHGPYGLINRPWLSSKVIYVWRRDDLIEACRKMETSFARANALNGMLSSKPAARRQIQNQLKNVPEIHSQLRRMYPTGKNTPHNSVKQPQK